MKNSSKPADGELHTMMGYVLQSEVEARLLAVAQAQDVDLADVAMQLMQTDLPTVTTQPPAGQVTSARHHAFCVLDGQPEPDHRKGMDNQISTARNAHQHSLATPYFDLKWYKKGTGHLTFTRLDLVKQLNKILHRYFPHALPAQQ